MRIEKKLMHAVFIAVTIPLVVQASSTLSKYYITKNSASTSSIKNEPETYLSLDKVKTVERIDSTDSGNSTKTDESVEQIKSIDSIESVEPIIKIKSVNPIEPVELRNQIKSIDRNSNSEINESSDLEISTESSDKSGSISYYFIDKEKEAKKKLKNTKDFVFIRNLINDTEKKTTTTEEERKYPEYMHKSADLSMFIYGPKKEVMQRGMEKKGKREIYYPAVNYEKWVIEEEDKMKYMEIKETRRILDSCNRAVEHLKKLLNIVVYDIFNKIVKEKEKETKNIESNEDSSTTAETSSYAYSSIFKKIFHRKFENDTLYTTTPNNFKQLQNSLKKEKMSIKDLQKKGLVFQEIIDKIIGNFHNSKNIENILHNLIEDVEEFDFKKEMHEVDILKYSIEELKEYFEIKDLLIEGLRPIFTDIGYAKKITKILGSSDINEKGIDIIKKMIDKYSDPAKKEKAMSRMNKILEKSDKSQQASIITKDVLIKYGCITNLKKEFKKESKNESKYKESLDTIFSPVIYIESILSLFKKDLETGHSIYRDRINYSTISNIYHLINVIEKIKKYFASLSVYDEIWNYPLVAEYIPKKNSRRGYIRVVYRRGRVGLRTKILVEATDKNINLIISARKTSDMCSPDRVFEMMDPKLYF